MYAEIVAVAGLAVAANAMPGAPPAYAASSSAPVGPVSSAPVWSGSASASGPVYSGSGSASASYSYSGSYSASASYSAPVPSGSAYPSCWSACFAAAGISSESALCGNTEVDACIQDSCSPAEDKAYWAWYESYCPATTSPVVTPTAPTAPVYSASSVVVTSPIPTASYPACWSACFAQNDVTSEAELCGDDAVSQCIYETCDSAADQAYWAWYEGYCTGAATVTSVVTLTSPCVESGATTWASTAWTPAGPPATSPAAPYPTGATGGAWGSQTATVPAATGTGVWPSGSTGWPVPATGGASVVAQSGFALLAGFLGLVALL